MSSSTKQQLATYAVIGAVSLPVARFLGEPAAFVFCLVASIAVGFARR